MSVPSGVFLSTVSNEFGQVREVLASDLRTKHHEVVVEEDFRQEHGVATTLAKLEAYIRTCEAVVCVIGKRSGSLPPPAAAEPFRSMLPPGVEEASYTQWELFFALHHDKRLFKFHATDAYVPDQRDPPATDRADLQAAFVDWVFERQGHDRTEFSTAEELRIEVLKVDLGTLRGDRHDAVLTAPGLGVVAESAGTRPRRRAPGDANRLKPNRHPLIGRDAELGMLLDELDARHEQLVMLSGEAGIGKRALLQELTHHDDLPTDFADGAGVHPFVTTSEDAEDLRQAIWEEFFETDDASTVAPRQRLKDLSSIEALVFLPDFDESLPILGEVLDDMGEAVFCISATEPATRDMPGEEIPIRGLDDDAMIDIFEDRYRDTVPAEARDAVAAVCRASGGNPGQIELLAKEARKAARDHLAGDRHPLVGWVAARTPDGDDGDDDPPSQQIAVAAAAAVGGDVPRAVLAEVAGSADAIDAAVEARRLEEGSPRYRVNPVVRRPRSTVVPPDDDLLDRMFRAAGAWSARATHRELYLDRDFVLRIMEWGLRSGWELLDAQDDPRAHVRAYARWRRVVEIGRHAEPAMALGGRHGAWDRLLRTVQVAARSALELADANADAASRGDDPAALTAAQRAAHASLGWTLHQRGTRALLREELGDARTHLNEALRHHVDAAARTVARRNLSLIPLAVTPFAALAFAAVLLAAVVTAWLFPFETDPSTIDITPDWIDFVADVEHRCEPEVEDRMCITVSNVGTGDLWIAELRVDGISNVADLTLEPSDDVGSGLPAEPWFTIDDEVEGSCEEGMQLAQDASCTIAVRADERAEAGLLLVLTTPDPPTDGVFADTTSRGDRSVVLIRDWRPLAAG